MAKHQFFDRIAWEDQEQPRQQAQSSVEPLVMALSERLKLLRGKLEYIVDATLRIDEKSTYASEWERAADEVITVVNHRATEALVELVHLIGHNRCLCHTPDKG